MTTAELIDQALALPPEERKALGQTLLDSVEEDSPLSPEQIAEIMAMVRQRDEAMEQSGDVGTPHEEVMRKMREKIQ